MPQPQYDDGGWTPGSKFLWEPGDLIVGRKGEQMSFMPSPGSIVRLKDGQVAVIVQVTPLGKDDRCVIVGIEQRITVDDIQDVIQEVENA